MCGRYALFNSADRVAAMFAVSRVLIPESMRRPRYNIAPAQPIAVVRAGPAGRELAAVTWGFVPAWRRGAGSAGAPINARLETAASSPMFGHAMSHRRCLVPVDAFYEWQSAGEHQPKRPHAVRALDHQSFALAGLWEAHTPHPVPSAGLAHIETAAIITRAPIAALASLHDRMPVVVDRRQWDQWLDPLMTDGAAAARMVASGRGPDPRLEVYEVSRRVNDPHADDAACLAPATEEPGLF